MTESTTGNVTPDHSDLPEVDLGGAGSARGGAATATVTPDEVTALHRALRSATRSAIRKGGVHTGEVIAHRRRDGHCPRCGAAMSRATVGGRTTWWCPVEQI